MLRPEARHRMFTRRPHQHAGASCLAASQCHAFSSWSCWWWLQVHQALQWASIVRAVILWLMALQVRLALLQTMVVLSCHTSRSCHRRISPPSCVI